MACTRRAVRFLQMPDTHSAHSGISDVHVRLLVSLCRGPLHNDKTKLRLKPSDMILGIPQLRNSKSSRNYDLYIGSIYVIYIYLYRIKMYNI